jgi:hypothetical protein
VVENRGDKIEINGVFIKQNTEILIILILSSAFIEKGPDVFIDHPIFAKYLTQDRSELTNFPYLSDWHPTLSNLTGLVQQFQSMVTGLPTTKVSPRSSPEFRSKIKA